MNVRLDKVPGDSKRFKATFGKQEKIDTEENCIAWLFKKGATGNDLKRSGHNGFMLGDKRGQ